MEPSHETLMRQQVFLGQVSAAGLLLTISALFYGRVFDGPGWVGPAIGSVLLSGALSVALARTGMGRWFRILALGVVGVLFVVLAVILPATSFGGPGDIGSALYGATIDGWRNALENTLPIDTSVAEPLGFVTVLGWLTGSLTGSLVTRSERSALPVVPPIVYAAISLPLAAPNGVAAYLLIVALVGSALLLSLVRAVPQATLTGPARERVTEFVGEKMLSERLIAGAPVLLALAFLAPLIVLVLPSADDPFDPRRLRNEEVQSASAVNPLAQLKSQREASNRAFLLELPAPPSAQFFNRMALVSLENYDGANWTTNSTYSATSADITPNFDVAVETIQVQQVVEILDNTSPWIPAAQPVSRIEADDVWYDQVSGSLLDRSDDESRTYTVISRVPGATNEQLMTAVVDRTDQRYTLLPPTIGPDSPLNALVAEIEGTSDYERLRSLEALLRDNFTLVVEEPSGTALGRVEEFLEEGEGYRDQFVAAFAIAARLQALPTRITVGYRIAEQNEDSTLVFLDTVTSEDYDAWPEVLFDGIGWVAFDPVPTVSGEAGANIDDATRIPEGTATASGPQPRENDPGEDSELDEEDLGAGTTVRVLVAGGLFLVVFPVMLLLMVAIAKLLRRRYRQNLEDPTDRVLAGWQESKDRLLEAGIAIRPDMTIKEIVALSRRELGVHASSSLSALAPYVTTTIYSPQAPASSAADAVWNEVDLFDRQLNETRSRTQNLKAKVDPRPLLEKV